jgi:hypothetical protein
MCANRIRQFGNWGFARLFTRLFGGRTAACSYVSHSAVESFMRVRPLIQPQMKGARVMVSRRLRDARRLERALASLKPSTASDKISSTVA